MKKIIKTTKINEISNKHNVTEHKWTRIDMHLHWNTVTYEYECNGVSGCGAHLFESETEVYA
jgi:hypothetical protein